MDKFARAQPKKQATGPGHCKTCGGVHEYRCAVDGCSRTGTMSDSIRHDCAGQVRWVCREHWARRA